MAQYSSSLDEGRITFGPNRPERPEDVSRAQTQAKDVVCGKMVDLRQAVTVSFGGHSYYFCSTECALRFEAAPNNYTG
jgi:YHS domain-containing protein